jgi:hypothetical protein
MPCELWKFLQMGHRKSPCHAVPWRDWRASVPRSKACVFVSMHRLSEHLGPLSPVFYLLNSRHVSTERVFALESCSMLLCAPCQCHDTSDDCTKILPKSAMNLEDGIPQFSSWIPFLHLKLHPSSTNRIYFGQKRWLRG